MNTQLKPSIQLSYRITQPSLHKVGPLAAFDWDSARQTSIPIGVNPENLPVGILLKSRSKCKILQNDLSSSNVYRGRCVYQELARFSHNQELASSY